MMPFHDSALLLIDPAALRILFGMRTMFFWAEGVTMCSMTTGRAPSGLGKSGRALWREINAEFGMAAHERAILVPYCRVVDRLDQIEAELSGAALTVEGSTGQPKAHPLLAEWRHQARVLESLSRSLSIPLPNEEIGRRRSPSAREAAIQRWGRDGVA
jgi:hypothetical protein